MPTDKLTPAMRYAVELTAEQVQALYLTLFHGRIGGKESPGTRPAFGWIEQPLVDIELALAPLHLYLHDGQFNAMNRAFFGDARLDLPSAAKPTLPLRPGHTALAQAGHTGGVK
jgi:hypothetical protein